jgi:dihydroorotate dehydrogenase subfamily 2
MRCADYHAKDMKRIYIAFVSLSLIGFFDGGYLTHKHLNSIIPPCGAFAIFGDCGKVLTSEYSQIRGIPLALLGAIHYGILTILIGLAYFTRWIIWKYSVIILSTIGLVSSFYFIYLQLFVIQAICVFCMGSAIVSFLLFLITLKLFRNEWRRLVIEGVGFLYRNILKRILFLIDPEVVHSRMVKTGELLGKHAFSKNIFNSVFVYENPALGQKIAGIDFGNPIGLASGFDYEARLTQILPSLGFGFQSVGTITNHPYQGNPSPILGRLPNSQSLMVNKGFKNPGALQTLARLCGSSFSVPVGVSIGTRVGINDILETFSTFERSSLSHSYYELNISCPNLNTDVNFYLKKNLKELLREVDALCLTRPLFVKLPIGKSDKEMVELLDVISRHSPAGVIIGNLQTDRNDPGFDPSEVKKFPVGNFSGKPTCVRSNELIKLAYKYFHERLDIIGCGGVFSPKDAYKKITLGASLIQLITGMIYKGPQLITQINMGLVDLLKKDGFTSISQSVGSRNS